MSIDRCVAMGYGIPISHKEEKAIYNLIKSTPDEVFYFDHCRYLNNYTGGTAFLGIVNTIADSDEEIIVPIDEDEGINFDQIDWLELNKLYEFLKRIGALEIIQWRPNAYLIQFIY